MVTSIEKSSNIVMRIGASLTISTSDPVVKSP